MLSIAFFLLSLQGALGTTGTDLTIIESGSAAREFPCHRELSQMVAQLARGVAEGKITQVGFSFVGEVPALYEDLSSLGNAQDFRQAWNRFMQPQHPDAMVRKVLSHIREGHRSRDLVTCMISGDCTIRVGQAGHYLAKDMSFELVPFVGQPVEAASSSFVEAPENRLGPSEPIPNYVFLKTPDSFEFDRADFGAWEVAKLFHEMTHDSDYALMDRWVRANLKRRNAGQALDELFANPRTARLHPIEGGAERVEIDFAFALLFLESRAHFNTAYVMSFFVNHPDRSKLRTLRQTYDTKGRRGALRQVRELGPSAAALLRQGITGKPISENNIFEVGRAIGNIMEKTVNATP